MEEGEGDRIVLECFVHITSRRAGETTDLEEELRNTETPSTECGLVAETAGAAGDGGETSDCPWSGGRAWSTPRIKDGDKVGRNLVAVALALGSSLATHWSFYRYSQHALSIPYAYPAIVILIISLLGGMLLETMARFGLPFRRLFRRPRPNRSEFCSLSNREEGVPAGNGVSSATPNEHGILDLASAPPPALHPPAQRRGPKLTRRFEVRGGRPSMDEVVGAVVNKSGDALQPGAFLCGPAALRDRVKGTVAKKERLLHGACCPRARRCRFYDEHSEM